MSHIEAHKLDAMSYKLRLVNELHEVPLLTLGKVNSKCWEIEEYLDQGLVLWFESHKSHAQTKFDSIKAAVAWMDHIRNDMRAFNMLISHASIASDGVRLPTCKIHSYPYKSR